MLFLYPRARQPMEGSMYFFILSIILGLLWDCSHNPHFTLEESEALSGEGGHLRVSARSKAHVFCIRQPYHRVVPWFECVSYRLCAEGLVPSVVVLSWGLVEGG
jgi:hypothetical protein